MFLGSRDTFGGVCPMPDLPRRSSNLAFDLEVDTLDICGDDDEIELLAKKDAERKNRKRMGNFNKRQRMSLFATATGAKTHLPRQIYPVPTFVEPESEEIEHPAELIAKTENVLSKIFSFFRESELMTTASSVCTKWSDLATDAHANLLLASVQLSGESDTEAAAEKAKTRPILERTWKFLHGRFPWACYLAEGGAKKVYKVHNSAVDQEEALSVM